MNKKKIIKKSSIFLGIASAIVTIPTVTSVVTVSKTNSEQKTNNSLGNNYSGVSNYKNGGTKNNETMNFDDILNGASKASISNPVYAFDENNQLVVPNINDELINNVSNVGNFSSSLNDLIKDSNAWIDEELIPYIGRDISTWEVYQILKYKPKIYLQRMNVPEKYIEKTFPAFCDAFESLSKSPVYRKLFSVNSNYFKIEDLSPVSVVLTLISVTIDTIITIISGIIEV